jgi:biopolymer transport protein ExbD
MARKNRGGAAAHSVFHHDVGSGDFAVRSEINVTPLVDVCLVLLIIFMVVTPMLQQGVDVALPETGNPEKMPEDAKQLDIAIRQDGSVYVGAQWIPKESLPAALRDIYNQSPDKNVVIKADKRLLYKDVREVMQIINRAGFSGAGIETHKRMSGEEEATAAGGGG